MVRDTKTCIVSGGTFREVEYLKVSKKFCVVSFQMNLKEYVTGKGTWS